jgi:transposase
MYSGRTVWLLAPYLNTASVNAFFRHFEKEVNPNVHVFMLWNQAAFHTSSNVKVPDNVTIVPLPPSSPQLNPTEKLWQYFKKHQGSNRVYEDYDALRLAAIDPRHKTCFNKEKNTINLQGKICRKQIYLRPLV